MGQALYRKYRSRSFAEVIGQEHITDTLEKAIKSGRISHAYLFTGPRGVGKTSVARILAHEINELPYDKEGTHLDIIEIDAASNRRIDEIRDLREKVHVTPTSAKYKVYIIDEVHMLTREAFNALLKTLEEPPAHVVFILATTEAHKLPETIISRTQRYNFKPISQERALAHLKQLAKKEGIKADEKALMLLAEFGDGSFRDSISLLDQFGASGNELTEDFVRESLGLPKESLVKDIMAAVEAGDLKLVMKLISQLKEQANDAANTAKLLSDELRTKLGGAGMKWRLTLLKQLLYVGASSKPYDSLELALLEAAASQDVPLAEVRQEPETPVEQKEETPQKKIQKEAPQAQEIKEQPVSIKSGSFDLTMWSSVLEAVKQSTPALYTALRLAKPVYDSGELTLAFEFPLHKKKVELAKNKAILAEVIEKLSETKPAISCVIDKSLFKNSSDEEVEISMYKPSAEKTDGSVETISNIFGTVEMLES